MAAKSDRSSGSCVFDCSGLFSDDIDGILAKLDTMQRCEVTDELADSLDMSTLMDVQEKVFRFAKRKLVKSGEEPGDADMDPALGWKVAVGHPGDVQRIVDEWVLIAHKGKTRVAMDTVEFMSYLSGDYAFFPIKSTKKRVAKGRRDGKKKQTKHLDPEQPLIPFPADTQKGLDNGKGEGAQSSESDCMGDKHEAGMDVDRGSGDDTPGDSQESEEEGSFDGDEGSKTPILVDNASPSNVETPRPIDLTIQASDSSAQVIDQNDAPRGLASRERSGSGSSTVVQVSVVNEVAGGPKAIVPASNSERLELRTETDPLNPHPNTGAHTPHDAVS